MAKSRMSQMLALLVLASPVVQQDPCQELRQLIDETYVFRPSSLDEEGRRMASVAMDRVWNRVQDDPEALLPCLRIALQGPDVDSWFGFDGSQLLVSLDPSAASKALQVRHFARVDLDDIDPRQWLETLAVRGVEGFDISVASERWLGAEVSFVVPEHGRYEVGPDIGAAMLFGSMDESLATPTLARIASDPDQPRRATALSLLGMQATDASRAALEQIDLAGDAEAQGVRDALRLIERMARPESAPRLTRRRVVAAVVAALDGDREPLDALRSGGWFLAAAQVLEQRDLLLVRQLRRERCCISSDEALAEYRQLSYLLMRATAPPVSGDDGRRVLFRVVDPSGRPIAGARAIAGPRGGVVSEPTDSSGQAAIDVPAPLWPALRMLALRYEPRQLRLPDDRDARLDVVLTPVASLDVLVSAPEGLLIEDWGLGLGLAADEFLLTGQTNWLASPTAAWQAVGGPRMLRSGRRLDPSGRVSGRVVFALDDRGAATVTGVKAGVPLRLSVEDRDGHEVLPPASLTIAAQEWRRVDLALPFFPVRVTGKVVDAAGRPVAGAEVTMMLPGRGRLVRRTDDAGFFREAALLAHANGRVDFIVQVNDHAPLVSTDLPIDGAALEPTLVLDAGRDADLLVHCLFSQRQPQLDDVFVSFRGVRLELPEQPGRVLLDDGSPLVLFEGIPTSRVTLNASFAGRLYETTVAPDGSSGVITVSGLGAASIELPGVATAGDLLSLEPLDDEGGPLRQVLTEDDLAEGSVSFPTVLSGPYRVSIERPGGSWVRSVEMAVGADGQTVVSLEDA